MGPSHQSYGVNELGDTWSQCWSRDLDVLTKRCWWYGITVSILLCRYIGLMVYYYFYNIFIIIKYFENDQTISKI